MDGRLFVTGHSGMDDSALAPQSGGPSAHVPRRVAVPSGHPHGVVSMAGGNESTILVTSLCHASAAECVVSAVAVDLSHSSDEASPHWLCARAECDPARPAPSVCVYRRVSLHIQSHLARLAVAYLPPWYSDLHRHGAPQSFADVTVWDDSARQHGQSGPPARGFARLLLAVSTLRSFQLATRPYSVFPSKDALAAVAVRLEAACGLLTAGAPVLPDLLSLLATVRIAAANVAALACVRFRSTTDTQPQAPTVALGTGSWPALLGRAELAAPPHVARLRAALFALSQCVHAHTAGGALAATASLVQVRRPLCPSAVCGRLLASVCGRRRWSAPRRSCWVWTRSSRPLRGACWRLCGLWPRSPPLRSRGWHPSRKACCIGSPTVRRARRWWTVLSAPGL